MNQYALHKTNHRIIPANPEILEMARRPDSEWILVGEADALAMLRDRSGRKVAEFFQRRQVEEAQRLLAIAQGTIAASQPAPEARPTEAEQIAAQAAAWAAGKSAKLTDAEVAVSFKDAGATAQSSSATPQQIAALPKIEPDPEEPAPVTAPAPAPAPAAPAPAPAPAPTAWGRKAAKTAK